MSEFLRSLGFGNDHPPHQPTPKRTQHTSHHPQHHQPSPTTGYPSPNQYTPHDVGSRTLQQHHPGHTQHTQDRYTQQQYPPSRASYFDRSSPGPTPAAPSRSPQQFSQSPPPQHHTTSHHHQHQYQHQQADDWQNATVEQLRAEQARLEHDVSVSESRLTHCIDGGDEDGAGMAASRIAREKKALREITLLLTWKEKRQAAETKIRHQITTKFAGEKATVHEHRKQVHALKRRLRIAFAVPSSRAPSASPSPVPSKESPPPQSPVPSSSSSDSSTSMFDLLNRVKHDIGRHQVALEHQCLHVDSIEMQVCVDAANLNHDTERDPNEDEPMQQLPSPSSSPPWSDDLTGFFKSSRKDVVTTLQSVLAEIDTVTKHLKQTEAFMAYLGEADPLTPKLGEQ